MRVGYCYLRMLHHESILLNIANWHKFFLSNKII